MATPTVARRRAIAGLGRFYEIPGHEGLLLPSVTNILNVVGKPALVAWSANVERELCVEAAARLWEDVPTDPKMSRAAYITTLVDRIGKTRAHQKELAKSAEIGTQAHAWIEFKIKMMLGVKSPEPAIGQEATWACMAWDDWARDSKFRPIFIEQTVFSLEHRYAGTLDLYAEIEHADLGRVLVVCDWKTGKGIYAESFLQNAAYRAALIEMGHHDTSIPLHGAIIRLPKVTTDPEFEVRFLHQDELTEKHFPAFLSAFSLWRWSAEQEEIRKDAWIASKEKVAAS